MRFSPDESKFYIEDSSDRHYICVFEDQYDGRIYKDQIFHNINIDRPSDPDKKKLEVQRNVYYKGPVGVWRLKSEDKQLRTTVTWEQSANCSCGYDYWQSLCLFAYTSQCFFLP